jgi:hypothetical protein
MLMVRPDHCVDLAILMFGVLHLLFRLVSCPPFCGIQM